MQLLPCSLFQCCIAAVHAEQSVIASCHNFSKSQLCCCVHPGTRQLCMTMDDVNYNHIVSIIYQHSLCMQGSMFSAILGDMLEAVKWPQDPSMAPGSPFRGSRQGKPESPSATRVRVPVGQIGTSTLAAHPTRQLFLTGL